MKQTKKQHCPEVEKLLYGKTPFITRHGITVVLIAIVIALFLIMLFGGEAKVLLENVLGQTVDQIRSKL